MQNELKIVGVQAPLFWEDASQNCCFFEQKIKELKGSIDLIVLPEMFTSGFTMQPNKVAEEIDGFSVSWMQKIASLRQVAICGSLVIKEKSNYFNTFIFVHPSKKVETYTKRHSFTLAGEHKQYTSGKEQVIITYKGWRICPQICYDLRFPVWSRNTNNYHLLIYVANWPVTRIKAWETLLQARAIENMSYTIGVNRIGKDANGYEYSGNSLIIDYLGEKCASLHTNTEGFIITTLHKSALEETRNKLNFLADMDSFSIAN